MPETTIHPWQISRTSLVDTYSESIFCLGNGMLGMRGFSAQEPKENPQAHGVYRAGLFDFIKPGITDMVQLPDVFGLCLTGGEQQSKSRKINQNLDMRASILTHSWQEKRANLQCARMVSMADSQLICIRLELEALESDTYQIDVITDAMVRNLPVHDDQMVAESELISMLHVDRLSHNELTMHTNPSNYPLKITWEILTSKPCAITQEVGERFSSTHLQIYLKAKERFVVEKRVRVLAKGEQPHSQIADPWAAHQAAWQILWDACDIQLDAEEKLQGAVRYNIFQLLCNQAADDPTVSIGARGLTHGRYKGNTFWDTEIFMLPFYLWTRPQAAKNLLMYRANRLEDAKTVAKKQSLSGARYPWMCSDSGLEQCESWDIGLCEVHITADVCYAMQRYIEVTGDTVFERETASEIFAQTALYWESRLTWEPPKRQYSMFFVKGPDEYCGATVNNTFTNYLARHNIRLALQSGRLSAEEQRRLRHVADHIAVIYDQEKDLYWQDETLERLEPAPFGQAQGAPMYKQCCFDRMQRYRVLKQADLVQLMNLFPLDFTQRQKRNVYEHYEPITLHDSTLSYGSHAQLALQLNMQPQASNYLQKAIFLDLDDALNNTGNEGIHMAALGIAWQALVFGAAGIWSANGKLTLSPHLPAEIRGMRFKLMHQGKRYLCSITKDTQTVEEA